MNQVKFVQDSPYEADHANSNFVKAVFHEFYLIHSWILCPVSPSLYQINDQWNILEDTYLVINDRCRCSGHEHAFSVISHGCDNFQSSFWEKNKDKNRWKNAWKNEKIEAFVSFCNVSPKNR